MGQDEEIFLAKSRPLPYLSEVLCTYLLLASFTEFSPAACGATPSPRRRHFVPGAHNSPNGHRCGSTVGPLRARGAGELRRTSRLDTHGTQARRLDLIDTRVGTPCTARPHLPCIVQVYIRRIPCSQATLCPRGRARRERQIPQLGCKILFHKVHSRSHYRDVLFLVRSHAETGQRGKACTGTHRERPEMSRSRTRNN